MDNANRTFQRVWEDTYKDEYQKRRAVAYEQPHWITVLLRLNNLCELVDRRIALYTQEKYKRKVVSPIAQCAMLEALCKHISDNFRTEDAFFSKYSLDTITTQLALICTNTQYTNASVDIESLCLLLTTCFPAR